MFPDTGVWNFLPFDGSPQQGRIDTITDRNGNTLSFTYDPLGRLQTVTDTLGRDIIMGYNPDGLLGTITDFTGRQIIYDYYTAASFGGGPGDLRSVTGPQVTGTPNGNDFPAGKTTVYSYTLGLADPALNHNLIAITDPKGQTYLQNTYSASSHPGDTDYDHVMMQVWGDPGERIDYYYDPVNPTPSNGFAVGRTIVNDRAGNVAEYFYNASNHTVLRVENTGRAPDPGLPTTPLSNHPVSPLRPLHDPSFFETRWWYNLDGRATRIAFPNQNERQLTYDVLNPERRSQGNLRQHCRQPGPLGGDQPVICETFDYDDGPAGTNFVTRHVDGRGNETLHQNSITILLAS
jgi:YD repeat-containing protein